MNKMLLPGGSPTPNCRFHFSDDRPAGMTYRIYCCKQKRSVPTGPESASGETPTTVLCINHSSPVRLTPTGSVRDRHGIQGSARQVGMLNEMASKDSYVSAKPDAGRGDNLSSCTRTSKRAVSTGSDPQHRRES